MTIAKKVPDYLQEKFSTNEPEKIRELKENADRLDKQFFEAVEQKALEASEVKRLCKEAGIKYYEGYEERLSTFTISTEDADRDSDVVLQKGIDLKDYKNNPVVLFSHNSRALPIGATIKMWRNGGKTKATMVHFDGNADDTGLSETIYRMVKAGAIKGASIGFKPVKAYFPDEKEMKDRGMDPWGLVYENIRLLEWSICSVPANQASLAEAKAKALISEKDIEIAEKFGLIDAATKPYPNEHACRLKDPDQFDKFRRENADREIDGKPLDVIYAKTVDGDWEEQAYRYSIDNWKEEQAKSHCSEHNGTFEAAEPQKCEECDSEEEDVSLKDLLNRIDTMKFETPDMKSSIILMESLKSSINSLHESIKTLNSKVGKLLNGAHSIDDLEHSEEKTEGDFTELSDKIDEFIKNLNEQN